MNAEHESDEQLMADVAWGNREPLGRLVRRYGSPLLTFIQRMIGDRHRSEELFRDVFLAVWDKRHSYRYSKPFRAWLFPKPVADAIRRTVDVEPEGRPVEQVFSGTLRRPAEIGLRLPPEAVEQRARLTLRIYPSSFSQLLEGLEAIFRRPYGCFEQTSSTT